MDLTGERRNFVKLINRRCRYKMARYTGASCKLCRRESQKLFLKGERCYTNKCSVDRRSYAPGMHGQQRKKVSEYGIQLREKQKAKRFYGVLESQFRKYYEMAIRKKGITGENLLQILESRLDNVVHRMGFGVSRDESRQLVTHGHFLVNGKRVNIPSYLVKPGDEIEVAEKSRKSPRFKEILEVTGGKVIPKWLEADHENLRGKVITLPDREDIDLPIQEHLIVELYSK
jgi:small subunit ribosomal protein S4